MNLVTLVNLVTLGTKCVYVCCVQFINCRVHVCVVVHVSVCFLWSDYLTNAHCMFSERECINSGMDYWTGILEWSTRLAYFW